MVRPLIVQFRSAQRPEVLKGSRLKKLVTFTSGLLARIVL
jgi:hypothetical protein